MLRIARREPSAVLLAVQLAGVLIYPFLEGGEVGRALFSVFGIADARARRAGGPPIAGLTWVALLLGAPATVLLLIQAIDRSDDAPALLVGASRRSSTSTRPAR